ncbi:YutD family protein [Fructobacillus sp. M1-13]|uniref:YutD family protein n=1 Tax=Fructobacillus papyriferae TaxID=2713171 RepID=A0ABS5QNR5_9LACO|nr:YutD family protein [Fructobacillus papyriferae]MBS9334774.1 YutD family protein [Fructobacillus papyriferae]MCD2158764.1 YutD family protein [Fructobacillus papyriferae]
MDHATLKDKTLEQQLRRQEDYTVHRFGNELTIDGLKLTLVFNFKEAFTEEGLALRYTPLLKQYDYVVGDLSAGQLRLRGFYHEERNVSADQKIDTLADYLYETVNFGAPYFILQSQNSSFRPSKKTDYLTYFEEEQKKRQEKQKKAANNRHKKNTNRRNRTSQKKETASERGNSSPKKRHHRFTERKRGEEESANQGQRPAQNAAKLKQGEQPKKKRRRRRRSNQHQGNQATSQQGQQKPSNQKQRRQKLNGQGSAKTGQKSQKQTRNKTNNNSQKKRNFTIKERQD